MKVQGAKKEAYTYTPSAWKVEKGGQKLKDSLGHIILAWAVCLNEQINEQTEQKS